MFSSFCAEQKQKKRCFCRCFLNMSACKLNTSLIQHSQTVLNCIVYGQTVAWKIQTRREQLFIDCSVQDLPFACSQWLHYCHPNSLPPYASMLLQHSASTTSSCLVPMPCSKMFLEQTATSLSVLSQMKRSKSCVLLQNVLFWSWSHARKGMVWTLTFTIFQFRLLQCS